MLRNFKWTQIRISYQTKLFQICSSCTGIKPQYWKKEMNEVFLSTSHPQHLSALVVVTICKFISPLPWIDIASMDEPICFYSECVWDYVCMCILGFVTCCYLFWCQQCNLHWFWPIFYLDVFFRFLFTHMCDLSPQNIQIHANERKAGQNQY